MPKSNYYQENKEKVKSRAKAWAAANKDKRKIIRDKWRANNWLKARSIEKASQKKNYPKRAAQQLKRRRADPAKSAYFCAKRRAQLKNASPKWLNEQQLQEIASFYVLAVELSWLSNDRLEVDHIIPLQGVTVCGLHVPWNLQILPMRLNVSKGNRYESK